ncbi:hypothetical protein GCM10010965_30220 [Caldalkalibacillus thermarum]|uniref:thermonuclease family protein n=1 Tax=Caldalkalibacillus thermarum TaxID=296745 RepID=UPI001986E3B6|nr:thermonuclease family protein [Caldalkalibacillus thermarum]GGK35193.1 hypothetical protein GCM10010965_30220 [Caldalkalibacillus thermarum]
MEFGRFLLNYLIKRNLFGSSENDEADMPANTLPARVVRVVDGDTFVANINGKEEKVRLILVDTPETVHSSKPTELFGPEASEFAKEMLEGKEVRLELDVSERDRYGRVLVYVDKASENKDRVTDDQTTNTFHYNKTEFETKKNFRPGFAFFAGIVVGVFIVTISLLYNDHLSLQSSDAVSSEFDSVQGFTYNEEFPNNISVENLEEVIPIEIEAIETINQANYLYSHRYGFVPDHIAEQEEKESL